MTSLLELEQEAKRAKLEQADKHQGSDSPYMKELKTLSTILKEADNTQSKDNHITAE
jgi:hypothetical protein